ncbi:DNA polymerase I [Papillibacter cinnamivorans]|uniref:DNA polymerase I n=1 Tax=Papillibacter cinnamivorans DSM 12816 TaxID=1122930 RepID=A0A1W1ZIG9_9FIRM|nr:DNA polymerase I [Papillibacter cinnamivorans]SMC48174.1 DNA polymerase I [Papillibacter cinnamivorans DSM 12816]
MKLMILDGNSIVNRAFYGIRLLSTREGVCTNAVYGFIAILGKLLEEEKPDAVCCAFDLKAPTFRHAEYEDYKAGRRPMPDELASQIPLLKETLDAMNIPRYEQEGFEADDIIGTVSRICEAEGWECVIATGDKDSLQLISPRVRVKLVSTRMGQTEERNYDEAAFTEQYGFPPAGMVDLKALMGDPSDHIPGVPGVGEKTAMDLVRRFGSVSRLYEELESPGIKDSVRKKLSEGRDKAEMSYRLATIDRQVPMEFAPADALRREADKKKLGELFRRLEFFKFMDKFGLNETGEGAKGDPDRPAPETAWIADGKALEELTGRLEAAPFISVVCHPGLEAVAIAEENRVSLVAADDLGDEYDRFLGVLFSNRVKKVSHEVKELMGTLPEAGIPAADGFLFDTALAGYLISATSNSYTLDKLAAAYLSESIPTRDAFAAQGAFSALGDREAAGRAMAAWASAAGRLYGVLSGKLKEMGMTELFSTVEMPLCRVLADMERAGFRVDPKRLREFGEMLSSRIGELEEEIYRIAGGPFNLNSPKQLGEVLFERLGLPAMKKTKTGYSTNADVLDKLRESHPVIPMILEYRQFSKLKSTYADGLLKVIGPDGRIHTCFQMTVTATGRLSSTEPNLQNIPVRTDLGSEIRKMFIPAEGQVLVDADYSQIELRLLAHISKDPVMCQAFLTGEDIHRVTASQVFGVSQDEVTHLMRTRAKAVNFGIVYGISDYSLSQDIGVTVAEARHYIRTYLEKYSGVRAYMKEIVERAKHDGYVVTLMNRRRALPELNSKDHNIRSFGERVALNMPIQGTAADIIKLAMVRVHDRLNREGLRARLILQVHDELIVEAPRDEVERVKTLLVEEMEGVMSLSVPLEADAGSGENWYEAKA